ncbi:hypothetical protein [Streptomyces purpureus]|uniref:Uncharacterized protein n=1 Tax=Streptomyces purpureus TaxID=1951 RepID=A0A918LM32_9ACTN|nr:hypothetical protein [Streptomyces purpureus]GGT16430.1 hypothetical protein GCM10014713_06660 [Streptomyces purpureus]
MAVRTLDDFWAVDEEQRTGSAAPADARRRDPGERPGSRGTVQSAGRPLRRAARALARLPQPTEHHAWSRLQVNGRQHGSADFTLSAPRTSQP